MARSTAQLDRGLHEQPAEYTRKRVRDKKYYNQFMMTDAEKTSHKLRDNYWDDSLPVDTAHIATALGFMVHAIDWLPSGISSALVVTPGKDPKILLPTNTSRARKRFECAWQLGAHTYHLGNTQQDSYIEMHDADHTLGSGDNDVFRFADEFSAHLLMPAYAVEEICGQASRDCYEDNYFDLRRVFDVPDDVLKYRLSLFNSRLFHKATA